MAGSLPDLLLLLSVPAGLAWVVAYARRSWRGSGMDISFGRFLWYVLRPEGRVHFGIIRETWSGGFDEPALRRVRYRLMALFLAWTAGAVLVDLLAS